MNKQEEGHKAPSKLADALARIDQAKRNYVSLTHEMNVFLYEYVEGMVKGWDRKSGGFVIQLRHPKESVVTGAPKVLVAQIVENLRTALDYMIFQLSALNVSEFNQRAPQFVIADSESDFKRQAKRRLRYLTTEQKSFVERIQPYHGNSMLALLGELAGLGKHRSLLSIRDNTGLDIHLAEITKKEEYKDYFVYPMEKGRAIFARPKGRGILVMAEKYDAMTTLQEMINHISHVIRVSYCFFEGRPLQLTIVNSSSAAATTSGG